MKSASVQRLKKLHHLHLPLLLPLLHRLQYFLRLRRGHFFFAALVAGLPMNGPFFFFFFFPFSEAASVAAAPLVVDWMPNYLLSMMAVFLTPLRVCIEISTNLLYALVHAIVENIINCSINCFQAFNV